MRIHIIQHVPFESPGFILTWAQEQQHSVSYSKMFEAIDFPNPDQFDLLIVMGGPMGVYEEEKYPWLRAEKTFIRSVIAAGKKVLGICLGSQLVAEALGAKVYPNKEKEIGWWPVKKVMQEKETDISTALPETFITFHWHGDTFDLPPGAVHLLCTDACPHQAYIYDNRVMGLQFHTEVTPELVAAMVQHGRTELAPGGYILSEESILSEQRYFSNNNQLLAVLLQKFIL